jgi:hypothetical protein
MEICFWDNLSNNFGTVYINEMNVLVTIPSRNSASSLRNFFRHS